MAPLQSKARHLSTTVQNILNTQVAMNRKIEVLGLQNHLLEAAGEEQARLAEEHYQQHIVEPMVRSLFPALDVIDRALPRQPREENPADSPLHNVVEHLQIHLAQFLACYDIRVVRHRPHASFDPKTMKPVAFTPCHDPALDGRVAESLQSGFVRDGNTVLRFESVALYRHEPSGSTQTHEKGEDHAACN
ncbi:MAG: nucleotide exchange factor GrpE [Sedimentisphaerales bacterium]|nr:nucleotide exchange factor GrpE [Sedimentisphaerales bacterium]